MYQYFVRQSPYSLDQHIITIIIIFIPTVVCYPLKSEYVSASKTFPGQWGYGEIEPQIPK